MELKARLPPLWLICHVSDIFFLNLVFFLNTSLLIVYLYVQFFFTGNFLDLSGHVIGHALSWKKNDLLKLRDVNVLENSCFFFSQKLNLTWPYVALNGNSENIFLALFAISF